MAGQELARIFDGKDPLKPRFEQISELAQNTEHRREDENFHPTKPVEEQHRAGKSGNDGAGDVTAGALDGLARTNLGCQLASAKAPADKISNRIADHDDAQNPENPTSAVRMTKDEQPMGKEKPGIDSAQQCEQ